MSTKVEVLLQAKDQMTAAIKSAQNSLKGLGGTLSDVSKSAAGFAIGQGIFAGLSTAMSSIKDSMVELTKTSIDYNASMEQAKIGFETMLGSAEMAQTFIGQMQDFAAKTPFEFPQVQAASQKFLAFGWAAKDVIPTLTAVGNAASGLGIGAQGIERISMAIGQMKAKGRVQGEELLQLAEAGIPAYQILGEKLKLTGAQVADIGRQGISADKAIKALTEGMNERFPNMMDKQAKSFNGLMSTVKDSLTEITGALGEPLFNEFKLILKDVEGFSSEIVKIIRTGGVKKAFEEMVSPEWQKSIEDAFNNTIRLGDELKLVGFEILNATNWSEAFKNAIDSCTAALRIMGDVVANIRDMAVALGSELGNVVAQIEIAYKSPRGFSTEAVEWLDNSIWGKITPKFVSSRNYTDNNRITEEDETKATRAEAAKQNPWDTFNKGWSAFGDKFKKRYEIAQNTTANRTYFEKFMGLFSGGSGSKGGDLSGHKGSPGLSMSGAGGGRAGREIDNITNKLQSAFAKLNQAIMGDTDTTYQLGIKKIEDELAEMQREVIMKAQAAGLDTTALTSKMEEYQKAMTEPIKRAQQEAFENLKNESAILTAQLTGDKKAQAEAEYQIAVSGLDRERREKMKSVALDMNDVQAKLEVEKQYNAQVAVLEQEKQAKIRDGYTEEANNLLDINRFKMEIYNQNEVEVNSANRRILDSTIARLEKELQNEMLNAEEKRKIYQELADFKKQRDSESITTGEAFSAGIKEQVKSWGTYFDNIREVGKAAAQGLRDAFSDFFFDAMTGKLKSLSEYFRSFLQSIARAISQMLANAMVSKLLGGFLGGGAAGGSGGGWLSRIFGGFMANGGPAYSGTPYIVGERGPELFVPNTSGNVVPNSALRSASPGAAPIVNIFNNSNTKTEVKQEAKFDGQRWVINVVLDAYARDIGGMRTVMQGAR